jgi:hypothetical protein
MRFDELNTHIPYISPPGKLHSFETIIASGPDWNVSVGQPGKYWDKTDIPGGDGVVMVTDSNIDWKGRKFRHDHLFDDVEVKTQADAHYMRQRFSWALAKILLDNADAETILQTVLPLPGLNMTCLLVAGQTLALMEHRRYADFEKSGGGRYLPARFALGVIYESWSSKQAAQQMYRGSTGLKILEFQARSKPPKLQALLEGK